jgi:hypothetical protein
LFRAPRASPANHLALLHRTHASNAPPSNVDVYIRC